MLKIKILILNRCVFSAASMFVIRGRIDDAANAVYSQSYIQSVVTRIIVGSSSSCNSSRSVIPVTVSATLQRAYSRTHMHTLTRKGPFDNEWGTVTMRRGPGGAPVAVAGIRFTDRITLDDGRQVFVRSIPTRRSLVLSVRARCIHDTHARTHTGGSVSSHTRTYSDTHTEATTTVVERTSAPRGGQNNIRYFMFLFSRYYYYDKLIS